MNEVENGLRFYAINNMYLSSIQQGIQTAHVVAEMMLKYDVPIYGSSDISKENLVWDWARNHKTIIVVNGGYSSTLKELHDFLRFYTPYPYAFFRESEEAMECMLTSIGIILPYKIYGFKDFTLLDQVKYHDEFRYEDKFGDMFLLTEVEVKLANTLSSFPLAR